MALAPDNAGRTARRTASSSPASLVRHGNFVYVTNLSIDPRLFNAT